MLQSENKLMKEKTAKIPLSVDADTLVFAKHNVTRPAVFPGIILTQEKESSFQRL